MASKQKMVTAVFRDRANAQLVYDELVSRGYTPKEINVLMSDATRASYFAGKHETLKANTAVAEGMAAGGAIGTAVGATLGAVLAVGAGVLTVGFAGVPLVIAGPMAAAIAALAGGGAGAITGGLLGALIGLGIPESNAKAYEAALREGGVVLGVTPHSDEEYGQITKLFEQHHGESVCAC
jgi:hypothetical protein